MKTLCYFVCFLSLLVLSGCSSRGPIDVVDRDDGRWVTAPKAEVSIPLLGVFADAQEQKTSDSFLKFDVSSDVGYNCKLTVLIRECSYDRSYVRFGDGNIPYTRERLSQDNDISSALVQIHNDGECISVQSLYNKKAHFYHSTFICLEGRDRAWNVIVGGSSRCMKEQTPTLMKMLEGVQFE